MGEKEIRGKRRKEEGRKEENSSKKEGKYDYFVSLFNIGPYDRQRISEIFRGGGDFDGWP